MVILPVFPCADDPGSFQRFLLSGSGRSASRRRVCFRTNLPRLATRATEGDWDCDVDASFRFIWDHADAVLWRVLVCRDAANECGAGGNCSEGFLYRHKTFFVNWPEGIIAQEWCRAKSGKFKIHR